MAEIGEALAERVVPYSCGGELQPFNDPTYDHDDWRCLMSFGVDEPIEVAIRAPVDISMDWEERDWLGRDRAVAMSAEIVLSKIDTKIAGIGLPGNLHRISGGTLRESIPIPMMPTKEVQQRATTDYAECLDDTFLRISRRYTDTRYWLAAAVWRCRDMELTPGGEGADDRCHIDSMRWSELRYPEWKEGLRRWYSITQCGPKATDDSSYIGRKSEVEPTRYAACLDNIYLTISQRGSDDEIVVGTTAWICRDFLADPPRTFRPRCELSNLADTEELFPEWPERMHNWHAIMECLPEWEENRQRGEDTYTTCLGDVYLQVKNRHPKDHAIPAAAWRCRKHMPEPPSTHNPRCEFNYQRRAEEETESLWPRELHYWNGIAHCYPKYTE